MAVEYEGKILGVDLDLVKEKLSSLGAVFVNEKSMRRLTFDIPGVSHRWLRLRDDGVQTTICVKEIVDGSLSGTHEWETVVEDFDVMKVILEKIGYVPKQYQENKRTSFLLDGVEVELDEWPLIPAYVEIEGSCEEEVLSVAQKLGFSKEEVVSWNTDEVYKKYGFDLPSIKFLTFEKVE